MEKNRLLIANNLRRYRKEKKMTQESLASRTGYHRTYISALERGKVNPTLYTLTNLSAELGIQIRELFDDRKQKG